MGLWILSQDKKDLINIHYIYITDNGFICTITDDMELQLGKYKSKERALEVLDEIQKLLMPTYLISNISKEDGLKLQDQIAFGTSIIQTREDSKLEQINGSIVYKMPKE